MPSCVSRRFSTQENGRVRPCDARPPPASHTGRCTTTTTTPNQAHATRRRLPRRRHQSARRAPRRRARPSSRTSRAHTQRALCR
eukprot:2763053-Prymnesium_polylepis.1